MISISRLLQEAAARIAPFSDSPRLDAEVLLARTTGRARTHFVAWPDREIATEEVSAFRELVERRCDGAPVAYLTGTREFWSREFSVGPEVLIPRPETELLVEIALELAAADRPLRILDLGTGSGAIAITLALELPLAQVTALDSSPAALTLAQENARRLAAHNIRFLLSDWFEALDANECFHLIVSNPPYIAADDPHLQQGDVRFEPRSALVSGTDGLDDIRRIARAARGHLCPGGWLLLEHGFDQASEVRRIFGQSAYDGICSFKDLSGHERASAGQFG